MSFESMKAWGAGVLLGDRVELRALLPEDLPVLAQWWNDSSEAVLQQDKFAFQPLSAVEKKFELWSSNDSSQGCGYSICVDGTLIGHITLWGLSLPTRIATCAIIIGPEFQDKGYGRDAIRVALRLAFEEMGAHKVEIKTWDFNERAVHLYRSMGFVEEGRRRAAVLHRGMFFDLVEFGLLVDEYHNLASAS